MKVLLIHNFYKSASPSGEDAVFRAERDLLAGHGIELISYEKHNDELNELSTYKKLIQATRLLWSKETYHELRSLLKAKRPEIAHFHNIFYLISPSAYYACKEAGVPVVQTLQNFRLFCVNGLLMKEGKVCEKCVGKLPWRGAVHGCYRNSRLYSVPVVLTLCFHRVIGTWKDKVHAYIPATEFSREKFIECGLPEEKIFVKPNFMQNPPAPTYSNDGYAVFLGRLAKEKGVNTLVDTCGILQSTIHGNFTLKAIGDGPLKKSLEIKCRDERIHNIEFPGKMSFNECMAILRSALFMIMPSIWYEGFPMVIREAFACGKPVIASRLGAMAEIIEDGRTGLLFEPGNSKDLALKIKWMIENEDACIEMGKNARRVFEEKYTAEKNYEMLMKIYHSVLAKH